MLKKFLKEQGFITDDTPKESIPPTKSSGSTSSEPKVSAVTTTVFPMGGIFVHTKIPTSTATPQNQNTPNPAFVKFFEDALSEANEPGDDYYEFRQQFELMKEKAKEKNVPEASLLPAILISFDTKGISATKLVEYANKYLFSLEQKKLLFFKESGEEKERIKQQEENGKRSLENIIATKRQELAELQAKMQIILEEIADQENTLKVAASSVNEASAKLAEAEREMEVAFQYMMSTINHDIENLKNY